MLAGLDHAAIPVAEMDAMLDFYVHLGCTIDDSMAPHVYSVGFGVNKLNFHAPRLWQSDTFDLRGPTAEPGCGDFCFVWQGDQAALDATLEGLASVIAGPVERVGGRGMSALSTYVRDPDGNLLEFMIYPG